MQLSGYRIVVTGCARGMGAATARAYAVAGADVIGMDIDAEGGAAAIDRLADQAPGRTRFLRVDVSEPDEVGRIFEAATELLGGLDVLAHPAAVHRLDEAALVTAGEWDRMMAVNVRGTMLTNQAAYRHMAAGRGGSIINFGSVSGLRPEPVAAAYSASKGAVHSWTRTAAAAWGRDGIRVNAVLPAIATPMYDEAKARMDEQQLLAHYWQNERSIALGESYGDPGRDLAPVMIFLASDASRFITGQLLPVDGGQTSVRLRRRSGGGAVEEAQWRRPSGGGPVEEAQWRRRSGGAADTEPAVGLLRPGRPL